MAKIKNSLEGYAALEDILNAVANQDNNHVEVIDRLDKIIEIGERIAAALEAPVSDTDLRQLSPMLADLLKEGRVS